MIHGHGLRGWSAGLTSGAWPGGAPWACNWPAAKSGIACVAGMSSTGVACPSAPAESVGPNSAAKRWKNQVNENAKAPAFSNEMPELCHNEIAGWEANRAVSGSALSLVTLRHDHEHPQISRRFDYNAQVTANVVAASVEIAAEGEGQLAQLFDLMYIGDFVSLHLAAARSVDPGPISVLDDLKSFLSAG